MSKTSQRRRTAERERMDRYEHGRRQAEMQKRDGDDWIIVWYPNCMAWRAGFLQAGGKRFW